MSDTQNTQIYYCVDRAGPTKFVFRHEVESVVGQQPYSTIIEPPPQEQEGFIAVWVTELLDYEVNFGSKGTGAWILEVDNRTQDFYTYDGEKYKLGDIGSSGEAPYYGVGEAPKWLTLEPKPNDYSVLDANAKWQEDAVLKTQALEAYKQQKNLSIDAEKNRDLEAGFNYGGNRFDSDPKSIQRISSLATLALMDSALETPYITQDNKTIVLNANDVKSLGIAAAKHEADIVFYARQLKDTVLASSSFDEVDAVIWNYKAGEENS